jgi:hypothetical protein
MRRSALCVGLSGAIACAIANGCTEDVRLGPSAKYGSGGSEPGIGGAIASGGSTGGGSGGRGGSGLSGGDGTSGEGGGGSSCDASASPSEDRCVVADEHAVFVAPNGDDENAGTMAAPVGTFGRALELAARDQKIVIACSGEYEEALRITTQSARIYGGFACTEGWRHEPEARSRVVPADTGFALEIRNAPGAVMIEDVEFKAGDAEALNESSVAGIIAGQQPVTLRRVRLEAGNAADGENGIVTPHVFPTAEELAGNDASGTAGGAEKSCTCPGNAPLPFRQTHGGKGGDAMPGGQRGGDSQEAPPRSCGKGGTPGMCNAGSGCGEGPGFGSARPPIVYGYLTSSGWMPSKGENGMTGVAGEGGGGGSSTDTGGGGGGGCGACGGAGGTGGGSGGASIALIVIEAPVAIVASVLVARNAGNGGKGASGQDGQGSGGVGGAPGPGGCAGGSGATGSQGESSAAGNGGLSVGLLWMGSTAPELPESTSIETGNAGNGGLGDDYDFHGKAGGSVSVLEAGPGGATAFWSCVEELGYNCRCSFGTQPPTDPCMSKWDCCYTEGIDGLQCSCLEAFEPDCVATIELWGGTRVDSCPL